MCPSDTGAGAADGGGEVPGGGALPLAGAAWHRDNTAAAPHYLPGSWRAYGSKRETAAGLQTVRQVLSCSGCVYRAAVLAQELERCT